MGHRSYIVIVPTTRIRAKAALCILLFLYITPIQEVSAHPRNDGLRSSSVFRNYFGKYLSLKDIAEADTWHQRLKWFPRSQEISSSSTRRPLADGDSGNSNEDVIVLGMSVSEMRTKISEHRIKLTRLKQEAKDLAHERAFLEKTLDLKKGQRTLQDGQVKLSQAELEDKAKEIEMYKREAPRTLSKYNELVRKQRELQATLNRLHHMSDELSTSRNVIMDKIQHLSMEDLIERHARGLPEAMAGALRKSAAAVIPFFDYLMIAADTNNRLVDHVGAEIDKYTHVNISQSPFMSGILFYCVMLIPLVTFISFVRRVFDSSSNLTVSHYIILGNFYFVIMCLVNLVAAVFLKGDPMTVLFRRFERTFIIGNLILSIYYAWHVVMLGLQAVYTLEKRNISQFTATLSVGIHYFLFAWRRVFTDNAPMMYTFNYMVYGTIFSFILYERYNRMSNRQLSESPVFRIIHIAVKRKAQFSTVRGIKMLATEIWASFSQTQQQSQRRFSRRHDRYIVSERSKVKSDAKERSKQRRKPSFSSDDGNGDELIQKKDVSSSYNKKGTNKQIQQPARPAESRGFIRIFFGSRENGNDSTEDEEEPQPRSSWRLIRGGGGHADADAARTEYPPEATRRGHPVRSQRTRDRREPRTIRPSIWKWP